MTKHPPDTQARRPARSDAPGDSATAPSRRPHKALPSSAIDLIRDGVSPEELREHGQLAVWRALGRTALAAVNAGYSRARWEYEVVSPVSKLGLQNRLKENGKERTAQAANKALNSAWARAEKHAAENPAWTRDDARAEAENRAAALRLVAADAEVDLADAQRVLLVYAADKAASQGSPSVNLPRAATAEATGLGEKAVRLHLDRLVERGMLALAERGRARTKSRPGRANVYRMPEEVMLRHAVTSLSRETRQVGPSAQTGRPSPQAPTGPHPDDRAHLPGERPACQCQTPAPVLPSPSGRPESAIDPGSARRRRHCPGASGRRPTKVRTCRMVAGRL